MSAIQVSRTERVWLARLLNGPTRVDRVPEPLQRLFNKGLATRAARLTKINGVVLQVQVAFLTAPGALVASSVR